MSNEKPKSKMKVYLYDKEFGRFIVGRNYWYTQLPLILIYAYKIINDKVVMGDFKNGKIANIVTTIAIGLLVLASILVVASSF